MADADQQDKTSPDSQNAGVTKSELDAKLGEITAQLQAMNSTFQESVQAIASKAQPQPTQPQRVIQDDDLFDAQRLESKVAQTAGQIAQQMLLKERELQTTIYNLAQEYPEIQSDPNVQKAVREAQAALPQGFRDTAAGLEAAVLKAVAKAGIVPKAKRSPSIEDGIGGRQSSGSNRQARKDGKVSEDTLEFARLLGRNTDDPEVMKRLEEASKRDTWSRYR